MSKFPVRTQRPWFELPLKPSPFSKKEKKVKKERKVRGLEKVPKAPTKCLFGLDHQFACTRPAEQTRVPTRHAGDSKHTNDQPHRHTATRVYMHLFPAGHINQLLQVLQQ
jgi:hypothetical protein